MQTINLTPTWQGILPVLCTLIKQGGDGERAATAELDRLCRAVDAQTFVKPTDTLNLTVAADRDFIVRTILIASAASAAKDDRESYLLPNWEPQRDSLDRLGSRVTSALQALGLGVEYCNRGSDDDAHVVARPLTVVVRDARDREIVIDLISATSEWVVTETSRAH